MIDWKGEVSVRERRPVYFYPEIHDLHLMLPGQNFEIPVFIFSSDFPSLDSNFSILTEILTQSVFFLSSFGVKAIGNPIYINK